MVITLRKEAEEAVIDRKQMSVDLMQARDRIKELIREKLDLETELHSTDRVESKKAADLEYQMHSMKANLAQTFADNLALKKELEIAQSDLVQLGRARDSFKQQYLELVEINRDLKSEFKEIEGKVTTCLRDGKI